MSRGHGLNKPRSSLLSRQWKHIFVACTAFCLHIDLVDRKDRLRDNKWDREVLRDKKHVQRQKERRDPNKNRGKRPNVRLRDDSLVFDLTERAMDVWGKLWKRWFVRGCDEWNFTVHVSARIGYLWLQPPPNTCETHPKWSWQDDLKPWPVCKHMHIRF